MTSHERPAGTTGRCSKTRMMSCRNADTSDILYMSSNRSSKGASWNPEDLKLDPGTAGLRRGGRSGRRVSTIQGKFVAGPVDVVWLNQARKLGVTAYHVGLFLWHMKGLTRSNSFTVSNMLMQHWGVSPDAKTRALRSMELAGLVAVDRRLKRNPRVTLIVTP
jgi:hypothetical protein